MASIQQTRYPRYTGGIVIHAIFKTHDGRSFAITFFGDTTPPLETSLRAMMPTLDQRRRPLDQVHISLGNQGDLVGNFTILSNGKAWKLFAANDEPWDKPSHRVLVE